MNDISSESVELTSALRVLVVSDQRQLAAVVRLTLQHGLYLTSGATNAADALVALREWSPQLVVIDMDSGGSQILTWIGQSPDSGISRIPVLALTRRGDLKTKLLALDLGVDDILAVPFSPEELLARVLAIAQRRLGGTMAFKPVLQFGELEIDILSRAVRTGSFEVSLTGLEQSLLYFLAANAGQVLSREEILDALWGVDFVAESNVVDRQVWNLRAKLQDDWRRPRFIATVPGRGYRFVPKLPEQERASEPD